MRIKKRSWHDTPQGKFMETQQLPCTYSIHPLKQSMKRGIYTFKDDEKLERGILISPELVKAIKESRIAVIIFSKNYASSSWCLDELVEIMECNKSMTGHRVMPIFYNVDLSDIWKQKGSFAEAFAQHEATFVEDKDKVHRWRAALVEAANLSGWDLNNIENG
ncbi:disease resistance protein RPV1-like isoform X2 [Cornus florida]|uniref:disease resistance protein RPV1-like isoform X2 n=1 Tax=Cornus florida TaxID=4283 RepID=UPI002899555D|nr:disease resistance protein RPV1-like isoform X2 [Cornus florida]